MRILVIGGTGLIGAAVAEALSARHEVLLASRQGSAGDRRHEHVDLTDHGSIEALFTRTGPLDAVVSTAGGAAWKPLAQLTDADFATSLGNKLMGQVHVVRHAIASGALRDGGSVTVTSGVLAQQPMAGAAAVAMVNAGLEGFVRVAALEAPRRIRVNCVSPGWVAETLARMGQDPANGTPAQEVARAYVASVEGTTSGQVLAAGR
jgi:NAD(P)-dependent dehydrogenase (short-subunit alcohol dehydrogenase family)